MPQCTSSMKKILSLRYIQLVILFVSSGFLLISRLVWPLTDIDFAYDQSRDMTVANRLLDGILPMYGSPSSRGFDIFPHYYYVTAFF